MFEDAKRSIKKATSAATAIETVFAILGGLSIIGGIILLVILIGSGVNILVAGSLVLYSGLIVCGILMIFIGRGIAALLECISYMTRMSISTFRREQER